MINPWRRGEWPVWLPRTLAGLALAGVVAAGVMFGRMYPREVAALMGRAASAEKALGVGGWLLAASMQVAVAMCGVLPASVGAFAVGMAYGIAVGFALSGVGTVVGAVLAFLLARSLFRPLIAARLARYTRLAQLDAAVCSDGWRLVALMRLSPVMPFALTSYALGLTSLSLTAYLAGTLASLPALLGYVVMGQVASVGVVFLSAGSTGWLRWLGLVVAVGATAMLTLRLAAMLRRVMRLPAATPLKTG